MKIDGFSPSTPDSPLDRAARGATPPPADRTGSVDSDRILLNGAKIQASRPEFAAPPEVRQERVDALREALASGQHRVDADRIAAAMLGELLA